MVSVAPLDVPTVAAAALLRGGLTLPADLGVGLALLKWEDGVDGVGAQAQSRCRHVQARVRIVTCRGQGDFQTEQPA